MVISVVVSYVDASYIDVDDNADAVDRVDDNIDARSKIKC